MIQRIICRVNQPCDMIYRAYQVASIMHIFPSVDIIVYDITRGSGLLPGNKAYHQTSPGTLVKHAALTARGHALAPRAARSSLHPHPRIVTNPRSQPSPPNRGKYSFFMPNYSACFSLWDFFFSFLFLFSTMKMDLCIWCYEINTFFYRSI